MEFSSNDPNLQGDMLVNAICCNISVDYCNYKINVKQLLLNTFTANFSSQQRFSVLKSNLKHSIDLFVIGIQVKLQTTN